MRSGADSATQSAGTPPFPVLLGERLAVQGLSPPRPDGVRESESDRWSGVGAASETSKLPLRINEGCESLPRPESGVGHSPFILCLASTGLRIITFLDGAPWLERCDKWGWRFCSRLHG